MSDKQLDVPLLGHQPLHRLLVSCIADITTVHLGRGSGWAVDSGRSMYMCVQEHITRRSVQLRNESVVVDHIRQVGIHTVATLKFYDEPAGGANTPT